VFTKLTDTSKAAVFSGLVLLLALGAALLIATLGITPGLGMWVLWSITPTVAALAMLLVVTREGYSWDDWKVLGLHRPGLSAWWIAFGGTLLITVAASAVVWATPLASFIVPEGGIIDPVVSLLIQVVILAPTFALAEEIGIRGYLLPKLLPLWRRWALLLSGLVWATWHLPLILLTPVFPMGNELISLPLFYGTVVAASFFYGYMRIYTGSVWPSSIAHAVHNAAWGVLGTLTATSYPLIVNKYLVGDYGLLILVGAVIASVLVARLLRGGIDEAQETESAAQTTPVQLQTETKGS
jgi:membrane protease YdiL (CAAX protease family)